MGQMTTSTPQPSRAKRLLSARLLGALILGVMSGSAALADTHLKVANFPNLTVLPLYQAQDKGYFKAEGLDVEILPLQTGPAAVSAVAAGQADIAWAAPSPPIQARANGVPVKIFLTAGQELLPDHAATYLVATAKSGVQTLADLKGKTVLINANGSACELMFRERLQQVGLSWNDVRHIAVPFPQMPAALELGNADAACTIDIAQFAINRTPAIGGRIISAGILPPTPQPTLSSGYFALESWLAANRESALKFARAYRRAEADIQANPSLAPALAVKFAGLNADYADQVTLSWRQVQTVTPESLQPVIDAMAKSGQIRSAFPASEIAETLNY